MTNANSETIEVLHDTEIIINTYLNILNNANRRWDYFADVKSLSVPPFAIEPIKKEMLDARRTRGTRLRFVTEITKNNILSCKEIMENAELRHLDGVKGNFVVSDTEYIAISTTDIGPAGSITMPHTTNAVYSNVKEDIQQQQYVFDILWNKGTPAKQRIKEIEEGTVHYESRILEDSQEIIKELGRLTASSNELDTCLTPGGVQYSYNHFFELKRKLLQKQKNGEHQGIRYISSINKDNLKLIKILLEAGIHIRHVKNLPPMSFGVSDKEMAATIEKMEGGRVVQSLLLTNEPSYVNHFKTIFEELWKNGIDGKVRIKDIEAGADLADIEVIHSSSRARVLYLDLIKSARNEVLLVFPTTGSFMRQERMRVIQSCTKAAKEHKVHIRILMPPDKSTEQMVQNLKQNYPAYINIRYVEEAIGTKGTILVVDRKHSLVMELRDDSKQTFDEAIGLSTYSNSKAGVLSYVAIFEKLWQQTELYQKVKETNEQLAKANEELKQASQIKDDFINIAAHELRNPVQPILGLAQVLRSRKMRSDASHNNSLTINEDHKLLDIIVRNAKKLLLLEENILDVARIENKSLKLDIEECDLSDVIASVVQDTRDQIDNTRVELLYNKEEDGILMVLVDKSRLEQVLSNLLSNSIKFTKEGKISVNVEKKDNHALVTVKDTGPGIDTEMLPRLFSKFATKSERGAGLGLFICKNIIEAHGGRIWAENNSDGKGAKFSFSLDIKI